MSPRPIEFPVAGLCDGVLRLRMPADSDVDRITEICQDPEVTRWTTIPAGQRSAQTREWVHRGMAGLASGTDLSTVITGAHDDEALGTIGLHEINRATRRGVAGYLISAEARGRGFATRALRLICAFGFDELRLDRIEVTVEPGNQASRAAAQAAGFREEGLLRSYMPIAGIRRDMLMCSILPGDLRPGRG